jgi:glycosyltransferase involved in cell wall biosynthesis
MKLLFLTHNSPWHSPIGGVSTYLSELIPYLLDNNHTVHILSYVLEDDNIDNVDTSRDDLHIHYANTYEYTSRQQLAHLLPPSLSPLIHPPYILRSLTKAFNDLTDDHDFDLIETVPFEGIGLIPYYYTNTPTVLRLHLSPTNHPRTRRAFTNKSYTKGAVYKLRSYLSRKTAEASDHLIANSNATAAFIENNWDVDDVRTVHPPLSPPKIQADLNKDHEFILSCGQITTGKGFDYIPQTAKQVLREHPDLHLYLIGRGNDQQNESADEDVLRRVHHTGQLPRNKLLQYMEASTCVVLGSLWEPFGYVCAEAMMMGAVAIATEGSGFEEQITDGHNGFLFNPADPAALETLITKALHMSDDERATIEANAQQAVKQYHPSNVASEQLELYHQILS